jgi:hypothetical protein
MVNISLQRVIEVANSKNMTKDSSLWTLLIFGGLIGELLLFKLVCFRVDGANVFQGVKIKVS